MRPPACGRVAQRPRRAAPAGAARFLGKEELDGKRIRT
ncbi:hypothetical protein DWUX_2746 [Desulfovibrio diazotrophicus]|nr:hypothetical protein DWUX_2746 [Desulfovibrio diazotrophicus]